MVMVLHQKVVLIHDARMTKYMEVASITGIEGVPPHERPAWAARCKSRVIQRRPGYSPATPLSVLKIVTQNKAAVNADVCLLIADPPTKSTPFLVLDSTSSK